MSITEPIGVPEWTVADRLRKARESRGMSQAELSEASDGDLKVRTISNYENPTYEHERKRVFLARWAFATKVPLTWILTGEEPEDGPGGQEISPTIWKATVVPFSRRSAA